MLSLIMLSVVVPSSYHAAIYIKKNKLYKPSVKSGTLFH
jgi:hypothetical protein